MQQGTQEKLKSMGIEPMQYNAALLKYARYSLDTTRLLLDAGADVNAKGNNNFTPLYVAVTKGREEIVRLLLDNGADIHAVDRRGETPLHQAVWRKKLDMASLLLDKGADIHIKNDAWKTPLDLANSLGHTDIIRLFVDVMKNRENLDLFGC